MQAQGHIVAFAALIDGEGQAISLDLPCPDLIHVVSSLILTARMAARPARSKRMNAIGMIVQTAA
ncbi:MAG: hypothetical protein RIT46_1260 [Pseudomonadota bacterium]